MIFIYFFSLSTFFLYDSLFKPFTLILFNKKDRSSKFEKILNKYNYQNYKVFISKTSQENAYAMGVLPKGKIILLTEGIINKLSTKDLEAILLHEIGHHEKKHILFFLSYTIIFNLIFAVIIAFFPVMIFNLFSVSIKSIHTPFILGVYGYLSYYLMYIKKAKEFEADFFAAKIIGGERLIEALNNFNIATSGKLEKKTNTHPTLKKRIEYVKKFI